MPRGGGIRPLRLRGRLRWAALACTAVVLLAGCSGQAGGNAPQKAGNGGYSFTVLESTPGFFDLPLHVAIAEFAPKYHLDLKIATVTGGGSLATEFEGGTGSVAMVGVDTPMRLAQQNAVPGGISIIGTNMTNMLYAVVAKSGTNYHQLSDLRGANVADTGAGAASEVLLKWALLTKANMQPTDVHLVPLGAPPTILAGVANGRVAAGTVFSPALDEGLSNNSVQMVFDFRNFAYAQNVFMARANEVKANGEPYQLFMKAYNDAVSKLESDPEYALAAARQYWGQGASDTTLRSELDFYLNHEWKDTTFPQSLYNASRDVLVSSGSGFAAQNFPTYEDVTKYAPKVG
jgi:ABC-type nitrate/sulfonate/bicarbonate transport system substrate-binding protein